MKNKRIISICYCSRLIMFITHFFILFCVIDNVLEMGLIGYLFLLLDFLYLSGTVKEMINHEPSRLDIFFNGVQIGFLIISTMILYNFYLKYYYSYSLYILNNYVILVLLLFMIIGYRVFLNKK